jgi:L-ascorbate metabolism protein UlaG (beta-lactamase superfamily)
MLLALLLVLVVAGWLVLRLPPFGGRFEGARLARMQSSPQWHGGRFENSPPQDRRYHLRRTWQLYRQGQRREPRFEVPVIPIDARRLQAPPEPGLRASWLGHATVLLEIDGLRVLTDPVLSDHASPFPLGVNRLHPSPLPLAALAGIDAVVVSHDHYDHLDMPTVRQLAGQDTHFYVGLGIGAHLERWGVRADHIHEMDWWDSQSRKGVTIQCTPARHYSGRRAMDNSTLWSSWRLQGPRHSAYYSGDTGYAPHFAAIRERLGDVDLTLMKVGAYGETWLDIHMDPESAVKSHVDLGGRTLLPVHWATFNLSYHDWEEPILRTLAAAQQAGVPVLTPRPGETYEHGRPFASTAWYAAPPRP